MFDDIQKYLESLGIRDFDDLQPDEKETYFKLLDIAEKGKVTLEDFKTHIKQMRLSVELAITDEPQFIFSKIFPFIRRKNPKFIQLQARLKNYIFFESLFDRPERAKQMLDQYTKVRKDVR
jgi:hypothetical protein